MTIRSCYYPFNSQDLSNSPLQLLIVPLLISYENLVTDQDNFYLSKFKYSHYPFAR